MANVKGTHPDDNWLERINQTFSDNEVPHKKRPWEAWRQWSMDSGVSLAIDDPSVKRIFEWFEANSPAGAHNIGALFNGAFYFDGAFWRVSIPVILGTVRVNVADSLPEMPATIKERLFKSEVARSAYVSVFADCVDYGLGFSSLLVDGDTSFYQQLIRAGDEQLDSTVSLLLECNPNPKAMDSARMVAEMFLKAYLARETHLTDQEARKKYGHDLESALDAILAVDPGSELANARADLNAFPPIHDRYQGGYKPLNEVWRGYRTAQFVASTVVRKFSGRDIRPDIRIE